MSRKPISILVYGGPGVGKTALVTSAFWDWRNQKKLCEGRWLAFGQEDNPRLNIPDDMTKRFFSPELGDSKWFTEFKQYLHTIHQGIKQGKPLDAIAIDGYSEMCLMFEATSSAEGLDMWNDWRKEFYGIIQSLNKDTLNCDVLATARVMEKKKAMVRKDGRVFTEGDPDFMNFDYYPLMMGNPKQSFSHYFNFVFYMETDDRLVPGKTKKQQAHVLHLVRTGDFYVKNVYADLLLDKGITELVNPMFSDVTSLLEGLNA